MTKSHFTFDAKLGWVKDIFKISLCSLKPFLSYVRQDCQMDFKAVCKKDFEALGACLASE